MTCIRATKTDTADDAAPGIKSPAERLAWLAAIQHDPELNGIARAVAAALAAIAVDGTGRAWPSIAALAKRAGFGETATRKAVHQLAARGWLAITGRRDSTGTKWDRNLYTLRLPSGVAATRPGGLRVVTSDTSPREGGTAPSDEGIPHDAAAGTAPSEEHKEEIIGINNRDSPTHAKGCVCPSCRSAAFRSWHQGNPFLRSRAAPPDAIQAANDLARALSHGDTDHHGDRTDWLGNVFGPGQRGPALTITPMTPRRRP